METKNKLKQSKSDEIDLSEWKDQYILYIIWLPFAHDPRIKAHSSYITVCAAKENIFSF